MTSEEPIRGYGQHPTPPAGPPVPDDRVPGEEPRGEAYGDAWLRPTLSAPARAEESQTRAAPGAPAPAPRRPSPGRPSLRRPWVRTGTGAAVVVAAAWAMFSAGAIGGETQVGSATVQAVPTSVTIHAGANDVEVRTGAAGGTLSVWTTSRCQGAESSVEPTWSGDTLALDASCDGFLGWGEVDHVVEVPAGTAVTLESGSGDLTLTGDLGTTTATSGSGEVELRDVSGALTVETGSGDVDGTGLGRAAVTARTSSGDVDLDLSTAGSVDVRTGSGDASLRLPQGGYHLDTGTASGDREVEVDDNPASPDRVTVRTGSGDIEVRYR